VAFCYRDNNSTRKFWKSEAVNVRWLKTAEIKIFLCWKDRKKYGLMASQRKPSGIKQKLPEMEILPQLFTPNKARRAHNWLRSGNYNYDEKMAVLKSLWSKEEERQATDKVSGIKPGTNKLYPIYLPNFPE